MPAPQGQAGRSPFGDDSIRPAEHAFDITPSDTTDLPFITRGLYVGATGDVEVDMADGTTITFTSLSAGVVHPLQVRRVRAANTVATNIVGLY